MREHPTIIADLGRKLASEIDDVISRKTDLVDDPEDKMQLANVACEAALGVAAGYWARHHGTADFELAVVKAFDALRKAIVTNLVRQAAVRMRFPDGGRS